jgi:hypothetical protein
LFVQKVQDNFLNYWVGIRGGVAGGSSEPPVLTILESANNPELSWSQSSEPATNAIWRDQGSGFVLVDTQAGSLTTWTDPDALSGSDYWSYKVIPAGGTESNTVDAAFLLQTGATASYPNLIIVYSFLYVGFSTPATTINFPALKYIVAEDLIIDSDAALIEFPALLSIGGNLGVVAPQNTAADFSFPALTTIGLALSLVNFTAGSFTFDALTTIGDYLDISTGTFIFNAPLLTTVTNDFSGVFYGTDTLSLPSLVTVGGNIQFTFAAALENFSAASLIVNDGQFLQFTDCALTAASVNHIMARGVASTVTGATFDTSGGASSGPTGQGIVDAGILTGQGNTVTTN